MDSDVRDPKTVRDLVFHLDNLFHARVHTLLVTEAILAVPATMNWDNMLVRRGVAGFAIALTLLVFLTNINIANKLRWTMTRWEESDPFVRDYAGQRVRIAAVGLPRSITIYSWAIPALLLAAWFTIAVI